MIKINFLISQPKHVLVLKRTVSMREKKSQLYTPGHLAQSVACPTADSFLTADQGVASLILARSHTFVEINHEIISMAILLPSADSRRVVVSKVCAQSNGLC